MAKKKRRSSGDSGRSKKGVSRSVSRQIWSLIGVVIIIFLFASIFDAAGVIGHYVYEFLAYIFGKATPICAIFLAWAIAHKYRPERFSIRFTTALGIALFVLALDGFLH